MLAGGRIADGITDGGGVVEMPKPTEEDKDRFRSLVPEQPDVEVKPMIARSVALVGALPPKKKKEKKEKKQ